MTAFKVAPFERNFFRIAGIPEAETSASVKAECMLKSCKRRQKVSFLEWPSPKSVDKTLLCDQAMKQHFDMVLYATLSYAHQGGFNF